MGFPGITKKQGRDFNYFQKVTVTWNTFGGGASDGYGPDLIIPFETQGIILTNEDATSVIEVSYNGTTIHDELSKAVLPSIPYYVRRNSLIWFRLKSGASAIMSVRAWSIP